MEIQVQSQRDSTNEIEPQSFCVGTKELAVIEILDRWIAARQSYFKVKADDGAQYILKWDSDQNSWQLTFFTNEQKSSN